MSVPTSIHVSQLGYGGAWIAAKRIQQAILSLGGIAKVECEFGGNDSGPTPTRSLFSKLDYEIQRLSKSSTTISSVRSLGSSRWISNIEQINRSVDVWNLHWIPGFPSNSLKALIKTKRIVWTLHDMNPFTGVCHWARECNSFQETCSGCPQFPTLPGINRIPKLLLMQQIEMARTARNLTFVSPSLWLKEEFLKSRLASMVEIRHIPNPIPDIYFSRHEKKFSDEITITILGQDYVNSKNSGMAANALLGFLRDNTRQNVRVQVIGEPHLCLQNYKQESLVAMSSPETVAKFLQSSHIFLYTSNYDNLPNLVLEAQAAGNAVIAPKGGGTSECFLPDKSGILTSPSVENLKKSISTLMSNRNLIRDMSHAAPRFVKENFSESIIGRKYTELYSEVILKN